MDVNIRAADGATALFMAVVQGHGEVVEQLLKAGADISIKGPKSKTPLEIAKLGNDTDIAELLGKTVADDAAFARATRLDDYQLYLKYHSEGRHVDEARRIQAEKERKEREADNAAFPQAESEGTGAAYAKYLTSNPEGRHADDAAFARAEWVGILSEVGVRGRGALPSHCRPVHRDSISATACAAIPSPRPADPIPSVVVALTLTRPGPTPRSGARFSQG